MRLRRVGYWSERADDGRPTPIASTSTLTDDDREALAGYLERGFVQAAWMGCARCRICGAQNGDLCLTDFRFVWPSGLAHYVREHHVGLPTEFEQHALTTLDAIGDAELCD